jgi:hypothetical protein
MADSTIRLVNFDPIRLVMPEQQKRLTDLCEQGLREKDQIKLRVIVNEILHLLEEQHRCAGGSSKCDSDRPQLPPIPGLSP